MIAQFAPLLLQYLGQQGIAGLLLQNLGSLWTTPAPLTGLRSEDFCQHHSLEG